MEFKPSLPTVCRTGIGDLLAVAANEDIPKRLAECAPEEEVPFGSE